jgi:peptidoglycan hydrolase-like protein with peptidoglycan-binding domain
MNRRAFLATVALAVLAALGVTLAAQATAASQPGSAPLATADPPTTAPPATAPPTTALPTTAPPTTAPPAPPTPPALPSSAMKGGDSGPEVQALQERLRELGYWLGTPDGTYGSLTEQAVMAFQKAERLIPDGKVGPATRDALASASRPAGRGDGTGIEIDLDRQLLLILRDGGVVWALNTSTGSGGRWNTPAGHFEIDREIDGVRHAPLGRLYRPKYFNGGIAVHGAAEIPATPASHGCARLSNAAMDMLWSSGLASVGTAVWVYD